MRLSRSVASALVAVALVIFVGREALPHARVAARKPAAAPELFGAECRTAVNGSYVTAYCHNPYPQTDRVALHMECDRWWDLDSDGSGTDVGPAQTVRLTGRCWKEVRSVWVSHQKGAG
ncbi:hypothetical protein [Streptomyces sp. NPDC005423]|uniref:hypothetical protein n=1 Tax=Streptomyces sp. NPDC005423 TaxID=3155343 RepID=UPI0033A53604